MNHVRFFIHAPLDKGTPELKAWMESLVGGGSPYI